MSFPPSARMIYRKVAWFLSVPNESPALTVAQFEAFARQVPLLYFILMTNMLAVAWTHRDVAPAWMILYIPLVFTAFCAYRGIGWIRYGGRKVSAEVAHARLKATNRMAPVIAILCISWSAMLFRTGNAYQQAHVAFYSAVTVIGIIICLMHLRSAAMMVTAFVTIPFFIIMIASGQETFIATGVNVLLVAAAMITVLLSHYKDFRQLALTGEILEERNAAVQALSDENLRLANVDSLTGLANRRQFFHNMEHVFAEAAKTGGRLAVGVLDLDGFKPINDMHGHAVGDKVLVEVGARLSTFERPDVLVHRLGGDEFALIVLGDIDEVSMMTLGSQICHAIAQPIVLSNIRMQVTGSLGAALYPDVGDSGQDLYERADYALYTAKRQKRAGTVLFNQQQADELTRQKVVEEALISADLASELSLAFQPIIDVRTGRLAGFEALARWHSPVLGFVSPAEFIPIAEQSGRITLVTSMLLKKALGVAATWPEHVYLSFNLSAHDLSSSDAMLRLLACVETSRLDPARINFEITETAVMHDFAQTKDSASLLRQLGAGVSLDDFGTGFSSLSHLHRLPLTRIKIDRSFVHDIQSVTSSMKIVKSVLTLCGEMDLGAVVEGVETEQELFTVEALGARFVQGYYFSAPIKADQTLDAVARQWCTPSNARRSA